MSRLANFWVNPCLWLPRDPLPQFRLIIFLLTAWPFLTCCSLVILVFRLGVLPLVSCSVFSVWQHFRSVLQSVSTPQFWALIYQSWKYACFSSLEVRPTQPVVCEMLPAETSETTKSLVKPKYNAHTSTKTYELFFCGDILKLLNHFVKMWEKQRHPSLCFESTFL